MNLTGKTNFLACGLLLMLAVVSISAQETIEINRMPLKDFAQSVKKRVEQKKIDLTKPFSVELEGVLTKDGKLDTRKSKFIKSEGDAAMIDVAKSFIEAVGGSGWFGYLRNLGVDKMNFALEQDESQFTAVIKSDAPTAERARTIASALNGLFIGAKLASKSEDDKRLLNYLKVAADNKVFVINFIAPREEIQKLFEKNLEKLTTNASGK